MYSTITKKDYFAWLDAGAFCDKRPRLKSIQDSFILGCLSDVENCKIAEIGGGDSRVLWKLKEKNECWNIDKFEGAGQGPKSAKQEDGIIIAKTFMGDFSNEIPDKFFDYVFSISVLEHVLENDLDNCFKDIERILKPSGKTFHAIDCYLGDSISENPSWMRYLDAVSKSCNSLKLLQEPAISRNAVFRSYMASDSDINMWNRNQLVPRLSELRAYNQCISLKAGWERCHDL